MFLELLENYPLEDISSVLDIGTGSGILSLYLYKKGIKDIVATDYMDEALVSVRENIKLNNAQKIEVKKSDLFSSIDRKFDLIVFNAPATHPMRQQVPRLLEPLWSPEENIRLRFLQSLSDFLSKNGRALLMYSKFDDYNPIPEKELNKFPFSYKILKTNRGELSESGIIEITHKKNRK
jgi:methylase of polypeptide subunit release factors